MVINGRVTNTVIHCVLMGRRTTFWLTRVTKPKLLLPRYDGITGELSGSKEEQRVIRLVAQGNNTLSRSQSHSKKCLRNKAREYSTPCFKTNTTNTENLESSHHFDQNLRRANGPRGLYKDRSIYSCEMKSR